MSRSVSLFRRRTLWLSLLVIAGAVAIARVLPRPSSAAVEMAGAQELPAYGLAAGVPVSFSVPPGSSELRLLSNLDLPSDAAPVPYQLRVQMAEDGRDESFPLIAVSEPDGEANPTRFFLDRRERPTRTRTLILTRTSTLPATLTVTLMANAAQPKLPQGSLRVFAARARLAGGDARGAESEITRVGVLAPEQVDPEVLAASEGRAWSRLVARGAETRFFYLRHGSTPALPEGRDQPHGEAIDRDHVAAFMVRGPGTAHLEAIGGPLHGQVTILGERKETAEAHKLELGAGERASVALPGGLYTLRVSAPAPARVRLLASSAALAFSPDQVRASASPQDPGEVEVSPAWSWQSLARAAPSGAPIVVDLAGRAAEVVRLSVRRIRDLTVAAPVPLALRWRFVDSKGETISLGAVPVAATPAPEDRVDGLPPNDLPSEPTTVFLWPPPRAERLLLEGDRALLVAASSPGFEPDAAAQAGDDEKDSPLHLRYEPRERRLFYPVRPANAEALSHAGRIVRLAGAIRLERRPTLPVPKGAVSLVPVRHGGRFVLLSPVPAGKASRSPGLLWSLDRGREESITVSRPRGAGAGALVPATLLYDVRRARHRLSLTVSLDGHLLRKAALLGRRGQIALPPLPTGHHRLRVDLAADARLFLSQPITGGAPFRRAGVFSLGTQAVSVALPKNAGPRALGVVVYTPKPVSGRRPEVEALIDGGQRRRRAGSACRTFTRLRRRIQLPLARAPGAVFLNSTAPELWASNPVFVPLGDDLAAGTHQVTLRFHGLPARFSARFFSYGGTTASRVRSHIELRAESDE